MAIEKNLSMKLKLRYDSHEKWTTNDPVLLKGEVALSTVSVKQEGTVNYVPSVLLKVGDGVHKYSELDFTYAKAADVVAAAKSETALTTFIENVIKNSNLASSADLSTLTGRVDTAEGEIDTLQSEMDAVEQKAADNEAAIEALGQLVGDKSVADQISEHITTLNLANTYEAKGEAAKVQSALTTHISEAAAAYETKTDASSKLSEAKGYTDTEVKKVQDALDDLDAYVGNIPEGYTETNVISYINKKAQETLEAASGGSTESAASVLAALNTYKSENDPKVQANTDAIDAIEADYLKTADKTELQNAIDAIGDLVGDTSVPAQISAITDPISNRVKTIEDDYLKGADKTELQNQITTNANAIERLTNGVSAEEVDGVNDLIQYVKEHGSEVTGIKADIKNNSEAIDAIEADYLKAADKTELSGLITGLDTRLGGAETGLEDLEGRVGVVESELNTETTGLKAKMTAAEEAIDALELKVGDKTITEQINAITNPISEKVTALEGKSHEHTNKTVLDGIEEADVTAWDAKVDDVTASATSGLKVTRTENTVAIELDDTIRYIWDCGDSSNT